MTGERRKLGKKIYWKKEMVERAVIRIICNKIKKFVCRIMYI
jgi:hypothetical protein